MSEVSISSPRSYPIFVDKSFPYGRRLTYANAARAVEEGIPRVHLCIGHYGAIHFARSSLNQLGCHLPLSL